MGKTIKLIQANLQHAKAASYIISRRFTNELLDVALVQKPWTTGRGRMNGLGNIPVENIGLEPTFVTSNRQEDLDLTVSTRYIGDKITNWYVSTKPSCSDHQHIRFDVEAVNRQEIRYRDLKCTD
ncbi:hypothetical protein JTB14_000754 [Gonioctena quinquepunctata]|nr:hypothetical protein JTB14_000754 [Gonioctena quinquepunctata]